MKISYNWLSDYIQPLPSPEKTSEILTSLGLEVESMEAYESIRGGLRGVVIGEVLSCEKHPNADKLTVCMVDLGKGEPVKVVCGAPNVASGQKVPVATIGTILYKGSESFKITRSKIRGIESEGMICAEDELGLGDSHLGIMVLDPSAIPGSPASGYFNITADHIYEIGLTPNRIDAASHYGVARDLAACLAQKGKVGLTKPSVDTFKIDNHSNTIPVEIADKQACYRYSGVTISGVRIMESPVWLKNRLKSIGLNPINNVVDITNFVMFETGQPLHAFDSGKITGGRVIVRTLPEGTKFTGLDGKERELSSDDLMICNTETGMCIAGVFGGYDSGVKEGTQNIFLESACFNPLYVRKTSRRHMLFTDSSFRFERGSDPNITVYALKRAAMLIMDLAGGEITSDIIDVYPELIRPKRVDLRYSNIDRLIGQKIDREIIRSILKSLDISVLDEKADGLEVEVATYRADVQREADVIEEILRIYGYNNIDLSRNLTSSLSFSTKPDKEKITNTVSNLLSNNGFIEIMSNSLTRSSYYEAEEGSDPELVRIYNPLSSDLNVMRKNLLYGGLEAIQYNTNHKNPDLKLYEFGNIYLNTGKISENPLDKYYEEERLALFITGQKNEASWNTPGEKSNFFQLKSCVGMVLHRLGYLPEKLTYINTDHKALSEGLDCFEGKNRLARFGKVSQKLLHEFDLKNDVYFADMIWKNILAGVAGHKTTFRELPKYPEVKRDLSMMLDKTVKYEQVREISMKAEKKLLKRINLFDVYEGDKIPEGKKSYAVSYILRDDTKTLTDEQIDRIMDSIARSLEKELGAQIRSSGEQDKII